MNKFYNKKYTDEDLEKLWEEFGNIPIDENDNIDQDFYMWRKGTYKFDIWHWFDRLHSKGVFDIIYK